MSTAIFLFICTLLILSPFSGVLARRAPKWHELSPQYTFQQYLHDFGKESEYNNNNNENDKYLLINGNNEKKTSSEFAFREAIFKQELMNVLEHNADKTKSWKMGINKFSDWTTEEKEKRLLGSRPDFSFSSPYGKPYSGKGGVRKAKTSFPRTMDYRLVTPSVMTAVKDQGNCGDCWAQAATETIESSWALATGDLFSLSVEQLTSCTPVRGTCFSCNGSFAHFAFDYLAGAGGIGEEWVYPFTSYSGNMPKCEAKKFLKKSWSRVVNISGYHQVTPNDEDAVVQALNELGPLAVEVAAFYWIPYETGIFSDCSFKNSTMFNVTTPYALDHSVVLAGYGYDEGYGLNYWIVRNSWAANWGEAGYIRLLRQDKMPCGWQYGGVGCFPNNSSGIKTKACGCSGIMTLPTFPISEIKL